MRHIFANAKCNSNRVAGRVRSVPMYIGSGGLQFIFAACHFDRRHAVGGPKWRNPAAKEKHALTAARCLDFASRSLP
ncbi:MAG: hypothetical protein A2Z25_08730 [Planctomycetes bacterium RBG_16_55_9]|nr:MAG: hypothetical protein A2Z25_08730 [Planctomycetes bacterium RBG_16_55_9]